MTRSIRLIAVRRVLPALTLLGAACNSILDLQPPDQIPSTTAITTPAGARAALAGAYDAMQNSSYYGGDLLLFGDLSSDNAVFTGTSNDENDVGRHSILAGNTRTADLWDAIYIAVNDVNTILERVPTVPGLSPAERDDILGQAYFLRALHYHNLVKLFGDVPLRLQTVATPDEAATITRSTVAAVYTQILSDLAQAETLITSTATTQGSLSAVEALEARVYLYQRNWAQAQAKADLVIAAGFSLEPNFPNLFDAAGMNTPEDIFKLTFTAQDYQYIGYSYITTGQGGAGDLSPSQSIIDAFAADPTDVRGPWSISGTVGGQASGTKFPTTAGAEDIHIIRFAEVLLIDAEALAQQNQLGTAVGQVNLIRQRAGRSDLVLGVDVTTQQEVLDAIDSERRLELAFEGDRWPDLVRTGRATTVLGITSDQTLYPIPQREIDVAPGLTQNPGY